MSINIDQRVAVHGSTNVQIGSGHIQNVSDFEMLNASINGAQATQTEKEEAKSLLEKLASNKLVLAALKRLGLDLTQ